MPPRIEPEGSSWLIHWRRGSAGDKVSLVLLFALTVWLTIEWREEMDSAVAWMRVTLAWVSMACYCQRWPPSEKIVPVLIELGLRRTRGHQPLVAAPDSLEPETNVSGRRGVG